MSSEPELITFMRLNPGGEPEPCQVQVVRHGPEPEPGLQKIMIRVKSDPTEPPERPTLDEILATAPYAGARDAIGRSWEAQERAAARRVEERIRSHEEPRAPGAGVTQPDGSLSAGQAGDLAECETAIGDEPEGLAGEVVPRRSGEEWADIIRADFARSAQGVIDAGSHLIQAREQLRHHGGWGKWLWSEFRLSPRTAQRFMSIARHPVLSDATHVSHLPGAWGTLYQLSRIPESRLRKAIESGSVTPVMERADVEKLAAGYREEDAWAARPPRCCTQSLWHGSIKSGEWRCPEHNPDPEPAAPEKVSRQEPSVAAGPVTSTDADEAGPENLVAHPEGIKLTTSPVAGSAEPGARIAAPPPGAGATSGTAEPGPGSARTEDRGRGAAEAGGSVGHAPEGREGYAVGAFRAAMVVTRLDLDGLLGVLMEVVGPDFAQGELIRFSEWAREALARLGELEGTA